MQVRLCPRSRVMESKDVDKDTLSKILLSILLYNGWYNRSPGGILWTLKYYIILYLEHSLVREHYNIRVSVQTDHSVH